MALLMELEDVEAAALTAIDYARSEERFPSFAEFRRSVMRRSRERVADRRRAADAGILDLPLSGAPAWVQRWQRMRQVGDWRALPQQRQAYLALGYEWPPEAGVVDA